MAEPRGCRVVVRRSRDRSPPSPTPVVHGDWRAGESLLGVATRVLGEAGLDSCEPWAVDLSGTVALLAVDVPDDVATGHLPLVEADDSVHRALAVPDVRLAFRAMTRADLADVVRWTTAPHVARWWDGQSDDVAAAERHYGPALDGRDPTRMWVVEVNGRSVGFVQDYLIGDHPEFAVLTAQPDAVGLDYAIGEIAWAGRGTGTRMLWQFLRDVLQPFYAEATRYFAAPDHRNGASLRVLDKLGFERGVWFDEPQSDGGVETMVGCTLDVRRVLGPPTDGGAPRADVARSVTRR